jgi:hypothetical protein
MRHARHPGRRCLDGSSFSTSSCEASHILQPRWVHTHRNAITSTVRSRVDSEELGIKELISMLMLA